MSKKKGTTPKNPHAVALGRMGGRTTSPRKRAAARRNAKLAAKARDAFWAAVKKLQREGAL